MSFRLYPDISDNQRKRFESYFKEQVFTAFVSQIAGSYYDFQIYIYAKDPLDFNKIINTIRHEFSSEIEEYETVLILMDYKFTFFPERLMQL